MKKALVFLTITAIGCTKKTATDTCTGVVSYSATIQPLFVSKCAGSGCHDGLLLPSLAEYNVAHDAAKDIRNAVVRGIMPKNGSLTQAEKNAITCWIDNGALKN